MDIEGTNLNIIKAMCDKPTVNIILNSEKLKAFPLGSGRRKGCPLSPLLFNMVWEFLAKATGGKKNPNWERTITITVKLSLIADDKLYTENPTDSTRKLLELMSEFSKVVGYKMNMQKSVAFLYTKNNHKQNLRNKPIYNCIKKNKIQSCTP